MRVPFESSPMPQTKKKTAKKRTVNKSAAIREYKAAHPTAMPKQIAEALTDKGIKVSAAQVSTTLFYAKRRNGHATNGRTNGHVESAPTGALQAAAWLLQLCDRDVDRAHKLLEAAATIGAVLS